MPGMTQFINPEALGAPKGYSNGVLMPAGPILFVAGQIGWDSEGKLVSDSFVEQFDRALSNAVAVVREAGGTPESVGRLTIYVVDKSSYTQAIKEVGRRYRTHMGKHFPAMALVEVADLLEPGAQVEIEATAVIL